jgi:hypothetical protein
MSLILPDLFNFLVIGLGFNYFVLWGIIVWTIRISFLLRKVESSKYKFHFAIAFLLILLGGLVVFVLRAINDDPFIDIGTRVGITILSGLLLILMILKNGWKRSLRIWAYCSRQANGALIGSFGGHAVKLGIAFILASPTPIIKKSVRFSG